MLLGMVFLTRSMIIPRVYDEIEFFANSPFIFSILNETKELLFFGRVQNLPEN